MDSKLSLNDTGTLAASDFAVYTALNYMQQVRYACKNGPDLTHLVMKLMPGNQIIQIEG
jgi:hypothetical protein